MGIGQVLYVLFIAFKFGTSQPSRSIFNSGSTRLMRVAMKLMGGKTDMTYTEFTVDVPGIGKVDVVRQMEEGTDEPFWDLFDQAGCCLNEGNIFWTKPTKNNVLTFFELNPL